MANLEQMTHKTPHYGQKLVYLPLHSTGMAWLCLISVRLSKQLKPMPQGSDKWSEKIVMKFSIHCVCCDKSWRVIKKWPIKTSI